MQLIYFMKFIHLPAAVLILFSLSACRNESADTDLAMLLAAGSTLTQESYGFLNMSSFCSSPNNFWARNLVSNSSDCIDASLRGQGTHVDVYVDNTLTTPLNYQNIADQFDTVIKPRSDAAFGLPTDINSDGKVTILILDIVDGATQNSGFVAGFFDPVDFLSDDPLYQIRSNERELLYMDGAELVTLLSSDPNAFLSTVAHEYQHLIRHQYQIIQNFSDATWINEGTSEVASDISGYGPQTSRMDCFNGTTCYPGVNGTSLFSWSNTLLQYAYAYGVMAYLYHSSGTNDTEKQGFIHETVTGSGGTRAVNADNLISVFKSSSTTYSAANFPAGTDNNTVYKSLLASFLARTINNSDLTNTYLGTTTATNIDVTRTAYPLPASGELDGFYGTSGLGYYMTPGTAYPSSPYYVNGSSTGTGNPDVVIINNPVTTPPGGEHILFNGAFLTGGSVTPYSVLTPAAVPKWETPAHGKHCPIDHLTKMHRIEKMILRTHPALQR